MKSSENREVAAAILASALIRNVPTGVTAPGAVKMYHEVLDALNAEHDRRLEDHPAGYVPSIT